MYNEEAVHTSDDIIDNDYRDIEYYETQHK